MVKKVEADPDSSEDCYTVFCIHAAKKGVTAPESLSSYYIFVQPRDRK